MHRKLLGSQGGTDAKSLIGHALPVVIARPALAENFNCGGPTKPGSVLKEPAEKKNIMGTKFQECLERVCKNLEPDLSAPKFKTLLSEFLKRSSSVKGGSLYKKKHPSEASSNVN